MPLTPNQRRRKHEIQTYIYILERRGNFSPGKLIRITSTKPNYETGETGVETQQFDLPRLVTYDASNTHKFEYDLGYLAANKNFTYGGLYEPGDRVAIFSTKGLPEAFELKMNDYIVLDGVKYNMQSFAALDVNAGYVVKLRATKDEKPYQTHNMAVREKLTMSEEIEGEL